MKKRVSVARKCSLEGAVRVNDRRLGIEVYCVEYPSPLTEAVADANLEA
jgi:hypothetical protein